MVLTVVEAKVLTRIETLLKNGLIDILGADG